MRGREPPVSILEAVTGDADLMQVVRTFDPIRRLANSLNAWQQQSDQNPNRSHHDQQFHERKRCPRSPPHVVSHFNLPERLAIA
jgi:hypothetical protein